MSLSSNVLVVFGATGNQGNSVAKYVLKDAQLSKKFKVRAVTRDPTKPAAIELQKLGAEVVSADWNQTDTVGKALENAHTVFLVTVVDFVEGLREREVQQGKLVADQAVKSGAKYLIFSTLPSIEKLSGGKYTKAGHFESKHEIEQHIRSLPIESSFFSPTMFMENFNMTMKPQPLGDGRFMVGFTLDPKIRLPFIDVDDDAGKFVGVILKDPQAWAGKTLYVTSQMLSLEEAAQIASKATEKEVVYQQLDEQTMRSLLPPVFADDFLDMLHYLNSAEYFGPETDRLIKESQEHVKDKLTSLEDYFKAHPLIL